jgi:hypothetical protein
MTLKRPGEERIAGEERLMRTLIVSVLPAAAATAILLASGQARAQGQARFGDAGELAISSDFYLSLQSYFFSRGGSASELILAPAADYFVIDKLSLGGQVIFHLDQASQTTFGVKPRIGYNIPISDLVSFWPDGYILFTTTSNNNGPSTNAFAIGAFAPFLLHPAQHFFIGLGPDFQTELVHDPGGNRVTQIGVMSTVGGWFSVGG